MPAPGTGLARATSVALTPQKGFYAPLEAASTLFPNRRALLDAFSYHPAYYHFDEGQEEALNYFDYGLQNSRGFRALKVWLALRQAGRDGYARMIADNVRLSKDLYRAVAEHPSLEPFTQGLSITTFRYVPPDLRARAAEFQDYLNRLNTELLTRLQSCGEAFVSNAVVRGCFLMRACIVNFRTKLEDVLALPGLVARLGEEADRQLRPDESGRSKSTERSQG